MKKVVHSEETTSDKLSKGEIAAISTAVLIGLIHIANCFTPVDLTNINTYKALSHRRDVNVSEVSYETSATMPATKVVLKDGTFTYVAPVGGIRTGTQVIQNTMTKKMTKKDKANVFEGDYYSVLDSYDVSSDWELVEIIIYNGTEDINTVLETYSSTYLEEGCVIKLLNTPEEDKIVFGVYKSQVVKKEKKIF